MHQRRGLSCRTACPHFAPATIEKWYLGYKRYGFNALLPNGRSDCGKSRVLDEELQEQIRYLKTTYPRMTARDPAAHDNGSATAGEVSESTVCRFVNQMQAEMHLTTNRDMRRYERAHINEVWCGDSRWGQSLPGDGKKRRVYIIALIDDASRYVTAAEAFYQDNFVNLLSVIRSGVSRPDGPKSSTLIMGRPIVISRWNCSCQDRHDAELL